MPIKRIDPEIKDRVLAEHYVGTGQTPGKDFAMIRKSFEKDRYFVYWQDGEIDRRDLYWIDRTGGVSLEATYQFENGKWIHLQ